MFLTNYQDKFFLYYLPPFLFEKLESTENIGNEKKVEFNEGFI